MVMLIEVHQLKAIELVRYSLNLLFLSFLLVFDTLRVPGNVRGDCMSLIRLLTI